MFYGLYIPPFGDYAYVHKHRNMDTPFDVIHRGTTPGKNLDQDAEIVAPYIEVGVTWWLENIHPWRFEWNNEGNWPMEAMRERILKGPPKV